ncbi:hypothetical protein KCM76_16155 [Zooshikella marina]|uniref:SecDF P1 head subdomain domain-containing protein n=1 Tax=Zooshikella ganghwensis TaxID=202772 RepID=A0A4P9VJR6_9GAMM|nr:hypothetical protein [Zooshikella ganghwensis]MBU2707528.1 hypothetical protein [Zooshikella ganghwensis]RDH42769.1 hypothetical protein B9G39_04500 [Zooshikella ganghwensis]
MQKFGLLFVGVLCYQSLVAQADIAFRVNGEDLVASNDDVLFAELNKDSFNSPVIDIELSDEFGKKLARFTGRYIGQRMSISIDGTLVSAGTKIREKIGHKLSVTGLSEQEASRILQSLLLASES